MLQDHVSLSVTVLPVGGFMQEVEKKAIVILNSMLQGFETKHKSNGINPGFSSPQVPGWNVFYRP